MVYTPGWRCALASTAALPAPWGLHRPTCVVHACELVHGHSQPAHNCPDPAREACAPSLAYSRARCFLQLQTYAAVCRKKAKRSMLWRAHSLASRMDDTKSVRQARRCASGDVFLPPGRTHAHIRIQVRKIWAVDFQTFEQPPPCHLTMAQHNTRTQ